jgi:hypothetical protein
VVEALMLAVVPSRRPQTVRPTTGVISETISDGRTFIRFWDIGGSTSFRALRHDHLAYAPALISIVNGRQLDRLLKTRQLFDGIATIFTSLFPLFF